MARLAEKPHLQHAVSAIAHLPVSYHAREQVRSQGRLHVHPSCAMAVQRGTMEPFDRFHAGRSPI
jgi:hypothetical protein